MVKLSFVIPCYGSELTIEGVLDEIHSVMSQKPEYAYEIICVNDCSPDGVLEILKSRAKSDSKLTVVDLTKNMGKACAKLAGFSLVNGEYVVSIDDDGQCPLDELFNLFAPILEGSDVSYAAYPKKKQSAFKNFGSRINAIMAQKILGKPKNLKTSNFSIKRRFVVDEMSKNDNPNPYGLGVILKTTNRIANVPMEQRERAAGRGHFTFKKSFALWLSGLTAFSVIPLRISSFLGALTAMGGFVYTIYLVIQRLFIRPGMPVGWASTMAVTLLVGGVIMMMLGMLGEYVGRIYVNQNSTSQYVIRDVYGMDKEDGK